MGRCPAPVAPDCIEAEALGPTVRLRDCQPDGLVEVTAGTVVRVPG